MTTTTTTSTTSSAPAAPPAASVAPAAAYIRLHRILMAMRETSPALLHTYDQMAEHLYFFRETWYEDVLRQLRNHLSKCYGVAFEHRTELATHSAPAHLLLSVRRVVANASENYTRFAVDQFDRSFFTLFPVDFELECAPLSSLSLCSLLFVRRLLLAILPS